MGPENQKVVMQIAIEEGFESIEEYIMTQWALLDSYSPTSIGNEFRGVPQGANTSPICSIIALDEFQSKYDGVHYADDGLIFSNEPINLKGDSNKGIYINYEKSGEIKTNNV
jgi:hypothetical protein